MTVPDINDIHTIHIGSQNSKGAYAQAYGGLSWLQRTLGDPPRELKEAGHPIVINGESRYVDTQTLQALQEAINNEPPDRILIDGQPVTSLDLAPDGNNVAFVPTSQGRTGF